MVEAATASLSPGWRAHLAGWCHNARAYARFRSGDPDGALGDCEHALNGSFQADAHDGPPAVEAEILRFHVLNNLCRVAWETGDRAAARAWQVRAHAAEGRIPPIRRTRLAGGSAM